jgi:hypothetical protein
MTLQITEISDSKVLQRKSTTISAVVSKDRWKFGYHLLKAGGQLSDRRVRATIINQFTYLGMPNTVRAGQIAPAV